MELQTEFGDEEGAELALERRREMRSREEQRVTGEILRAVIVVRLIM